MTRDTYTGEEDEPLSLHLYGYCGNDGVNAWDPSGHEIEWWAEMYMYFSGFLGSPNGRGDQAKENYKKNKELEKKMRVGIIYHQEDYPVNQMIYGNAEFSGTGCELVAIYNAIYIKKYKRISMANLIKYCEEKNYCMRNGTWGTTPYKIGKILTYYGIKYSLCKKKDLKKPKRRKRNIYIVSVWNNGGLLNGVHTFMTVGKNNGFITYNDCELNKNYRIAINKKELLHGRKYIIGYKLK